MDFFKFDPDKQTIQDTLPQGFCYVPQDHYFFTRLDAIEPEFRYLYTDGATSCIMAVIEGYNAEKIPQLLFAHLSTLYTFHLYLNFINKHFTGAVNLYAQGANPPDNETALLNGSYFTDLFALLTWEAVRREKISREVSFFIDNAHLELYNGDPRLENRGCLGIDLEAHIISNRAFQLMPEQRDSTGGIRTLFSLFNDAFEGKDKALYSLWDIRLPLPGKLVQKLLVKADQENWQQILSLSDEEILENFSSTPHHEPSWFVHSIRRMCEWLTQTGKK